MIGCNSVIGAGCVYHIHSNELDNRLTLLENDANGVYFLYELSRLLFSFE